MIQADRAVTRPSSSVQKLDVCPILLESDPKTYFSRLPLPDLLHALDGNPALMRAYWGSCQPALKFKWDMPFETFETVIKTAAGLLRQRADRAEETLRTLETALSAAVGPVSGARLVTAMREGRLPFLSSSELLDEHGNFVPQSVKLDVSADSSVDLGLKLVPDFVNAGVLRAITNQYLFASCVALTEAEPKAAGAGAVITQLSRLYDRTPTIRLLDADVTQSLLDIHCEALRLRSQYRGADTEFLTRKGRWEAHNFIRALIEDMSGAQFAGFKVEEGFTPKDLESWYLRHSRNSSFSPETFAMFARNACVELLELANQRVERMIAGFRSSGESVLRYSRWMPLENVLERISYFSRIYADGRWAQSRPSATEVNAFISVIPHNDLVRFIRFADGIPCCVSSRKKDLEIRQGFENFAANLLVDEPSIVFQVHTDKEVLGFILGHISTQDNRPGYVSYVMYSTFSDPLAVSNCWNVAAKIASQISLAWMGQTPCPDERRQTVHGWSQHPPRGWEAAKITITRFQTAPGEVVSSDLEWATPNALATGTLFIKHPSPVG